MNLSLRGSVTAVLVAAVVLMMSAFAEAQDINDTLMRKQADLFLCAMPDSMQYHQAKAVSRAIAGDLSELVKVRSSRNVRPAVSENVRTMELSPLLRLYEPSCCDGGPLPLLIYFHGGGWTFGSINSCGRFCDAMAATGKMKVLAVEYRLAPENPYPCAYLDCVESVGYALRNYRELGVDPGRISVGGDSAGGNLAIAASLDPECAGKVESLVLFYPVVLAYPDGSDSWKEFGEGYALDSRLMEQFNLAYSQKVPSGISQIDVGTLPGDELERLPRTLMIAAGRDILRDQGKWFAEKAPSGRIRRIEFTDAVHLFITVPGQEAAFRSAVEISSCFVAGTE